MKGKRLLAIILTLVMVIGLVPGQVFAVDNSTAQPAKYQEVLGNITVNVDVPDDAFEEPVDLKVTQLANGSEGYKDADIALSSKGFDYDEMLAFDISFVSKETGLEVEPAAEIGVSMELNSALLSKVDAASVKVTHIEEEGATLVADPANEAEGKVEVKFQTLKANFSVSSFSTFTISWKNAEEADESATIHFGTQSGETFTEFDEDKVVTMDDTASSISLAVDFDGYAYLDAYYVADGTTEKVPVNTTLKKVDGKWQIEKLVMNAETGELESEWADLGDKDNIYVTYVVPTSPTPSGAGDDKIPTPDTEKDVTVNADGTRTITLDITGDKVTEDKSFGANVLIVLDRTASMGTNMPSSTTTRWAAAKSAINTLVTTLTSGSNTGNVEFGLLDFVCPDGYNNGDSTYFGRPYNAYYYNLNTLHHWNTSGAHANTGSYWTTNATNYNNYIQSNSFT